MNFEMQCVILSCSSSELVNSHMDKEYQGELGYNMFLHGRKLKPFCGQISAFGSLLADQMIVLFLKYSECVLNSSLWY